MDKTRATITIKPPKLIQGDTIGIVAPCLPVLPSFRDKYERGKQVLTDMGFQLKEGATVHGTRHFYSADTPEHQAADINSMFADPNIRAVIATSGGHSAISVLPFLDYDCIRTNPKPFIGMSDMTAYHLAIYAHTGVVGFHMDDLTFGLGLNWADAHEADRQIISQAFKDVLVNASLLGDIPSVSNRESWRSGAASGVLIGGNLKLIANQVGTPYFPPLDAFDGAILFWEEVGEPIYGIVRSLYQLKYAGVMERIAGMVVGAVSDIAPVSDSEIIEPSVKEAVLDVVKEYDFPILAGVDCGHYIMNMPMPIGVSASFETTSLRLRLDEGAVC